MAGEIPGVAVMTQGWSKPFGLKEAHYFANNRSLCGKWGLPKDYGRTFHQNLFDKKNCVDCKERFIKREHDWPKKIQEGAS